GMDRIPAALTRAIGERRIRTGAAVTDLKNTAHGVTVTYTRGGREHRVDADYCVAALPPNILAKTSHNLGPAVQ
ncbi:FAD-dependent oxidoreductase, partial [Streptomyces sp. SID11233]|nr:FAD-dependent oxidoreductase [Streptomyces sp. SID11233]